MFFKRFLWWNSTFIHESVYKMWNGIVFLGQAYPRVIRKNFWGRYRLLQITLCLPLNFGFACMWQLRIGDKLRILLLRSVYMCVHGCLLCVSCWSCVLCSVCIWHVWGVCLVNWGPRNSHEVSVRRELWINERSSWFFGVTCRHTSWEPFPSHALYEPLFPFPEQRHTLSMRLAIYLQLVSWKVPGYLIYQPCVYICVAHTHAETWREQRSYTDLGSSFGVW